MSPTPVLDFTLDRDFSVQDFDMGTVIPTKITLKIDPASPIAVTRGSYGLVFSPPPATPTTHTLAITQGGGAVSVVNGITATQLIPAGTITTNLGFDVAGKLVTASTLPPTGRYTMASDINAASNSNYGTFVKVPLVAPATQVPGVTVNNGTLSFAGPGCWLVSGQTYINGDSQNSVIQMVAGVTLTPTGIRQEFVTPGVLTATGISAVSTVVTVAAGQTTTLMLDTKNIGSSGSGIIRSASTYLDVAKIA